MDHYLTTEPAQVDHRWAAHSEWDIGRSFRSRWTRFCHAANGQRHNGIKRLSMMVPGSKDIGTIHTDRTYRSRNFLVKIYPIVVRPIKAFNRAIMQGSATHRYRGQETFGSLVWRRSHQSDVSASVVLLQSLL